MYDYSLSFDAEYLQVKYTIEYTDPVSSKKEARSRTDKIPIYDLKDVTVNNSHFLLYLSTNSETILSVESNGEKTVSGIFAIGFKWNAETDLVSRIKKAFLHLKDFLQKADFQRNLLINSVIIMIALIIAPYVLANT